MFIDNNAASKYNSGFSLYLVIVITTIVAVLLSVYIYKLQMTHKSAAIELKKFQARMTAESGLVRAEYFLNGGDGHTVDWETTDYKELLDTFSTISITNTSFGGFAKIISRGQRLDYMSSISGLFGRSLPPLLQPAITLTGHVGGLALKDGSNVKGDIVLHHGSVQIGGLLIPAKIKNSPLLPFDTTIVAKRMDILSQQFLKLLTIPHSVTGSVRWQDLTDSTLKKDTIAILGNCQIAQSTIKNKVIAVSGTVTILQDASIQNTIIYSEKCIIDKSVTDKCLFYAGNGCQIKDGTHNSQFFSRDTLHIKRNVSWGQLTLCINYREKKNDSLVSGGIFIDSGSIFTGTLISCLDTSARKSILWPSVTIGKGSKINGRIITDYSLDINNTDVKGHIWASQILTVKDKISYSNYLFNCKISNHTAEFPFPLFAPLPFTIVFIKDGIRYERNSR
jgi:hypothetical protein